MLWPASTPHSAKVHATATAPAPDTSNAYGARGRRSLCGLDAYGGGLDIAFSRYDETERCRLCDRAIAGREARAAS